MALEGSGWEAPTRALAGAGIGGRTGRLETALLRCRGRGLAMRCLGVDAVTLPPPPARTAGLADAVSDAVISLAKNCQVPLDALDVLGLDGLPSTGASVEVAAILARRTGVTTVTAFELADRACGGRGTPLSLMPDWFLHHASDRGRLMVHLGLSLRMSWLPAGKLPADSVCFDAGPCCGFLDGLVQDLSQGRYAFDPGGHFAVQGRSADELIRQWQSHPFLVSIPPKFLAPDDFGEPFRQASFALARELGLSARDVLCSASHFVVRNCLDALDRFLLPRVRIDEVWASGGGCSNGFLWRLLIDGLKPLPILRTDSVGIPLDARRAIHAALLGYCTMENLPGNVASVTGAGQPCILGQICPGSASNWDRFVGNLADRFAIQERRAA